MVFGFKREYDKNLKKYINCKRGLPEDWLKVNENRAYRLSNNLRLNEISILFTILQFNRFFDTETEFSLLFNIIPSYL